MMKTWLYLFITVMMFFVAPLPTAIASVKHTDLPAQSNEVISPAHRNDKINLTIRGIAFSANFTNKPIRKVLQSIANQSSVVFYLAPSIQKKISLRVKGLPLDQAIKRITKGLNTAFVWSNSAKNAQITAVHILPQGDTSTLFETIAAKQTKPKALNLVSKTKSLTLKSSPGSSSTSPFCEKMRDGVEISYVADERLIRIDPEQYFNNAIRWLNGVVCQHHGVLAFLVLQVEPNAPILAIKALEQFDMSTSAESISHTLDK